MILSQEFWAAVRLVEFANLRVDPKDWFSLYAYDPRDLGWTKEASRWLTSRGKRWEAVLGFPSARWLRPKPPPFAGELWRDYVAGLFRYGRPPNEFDAGRIYEKFAEESFREGDRGPLSPAAARKIMQRFHSRRRSLPDIVPLSPWPKVEGDRRDYSAFKELHERTRARLDLICKEDADLSDLLAELAGEYCPRYGLFAAFSEGRVTKRGPFLLEVEQPPTDLAAHLALLFVHSANGGMWPRLYRCENCGRFVVDRLRRTSEGRSAGRTCSPACRAKLRRTTNALKEEQRRTEIVGALKALQANHKREALETIRKKYGLSRRELSAILRG